MNFRISLFSIPSLGSLRSILRSNIVGVHVNVILDQIFARELSVFWFMILPRLDQNMSRFIVNLTIAHASDHEVECLPSNLLADQRWIGPYDDGAVQISIQGEFDAELISIFVNIEWWASKKPDSTWESINRTTPHYPHVTLKKLPPLSLLPPLPCNTNGLLLPHV